MEINGQVQ